MDKLVMYEIRRTLKTSYGYITDGLWSEIETEITNDVRENLLRFGRTVSAEYMLYVADTYMKLLSRLAN